MRCWVFCNISIASKYGFTKSLCWNRKASFFIYNILERVECLCHKSYMCCIRSEFEHQQDFQNIFYISTFCRRTHRPKSQVECEFWLFFKICEITAAGLVFTPIVLSSRVSNLSQTDKTASPITEITDGKISQLVPFAEKNCFESLIVRFKGCS